MMLAAQKFESPEWYFDVVMISELSTTLSVRVMNKTVTPGSRFAEAHAFGVNCPSLLFTTNR
jgi:hypothetical protein